MGIHVGHTAWAKIKNKNAAIEDDALYVWLVSDIQTNPSVNCWMANMPGIAAKGHWVGFCVPRKAITAVPERTAPAVKLAAVEKHIYLVF
jgi:hypothetical protein